MASFSGPKLSNRIADDVPDIQAILSSLAKLTPDSGNTDYPIGTKRVAETNNGYEFQQYNGTSWVTLEKWNLDAQKVDGYSASTGTTANTIPVRNANGKLPGDILGNAATATKATALSDTNPIATGGTGATTAEQARANLGTPPKAHASTSTEYGAGTSTQYGHLKSHDEPDATLTAATGHAFSPAGAASLKTELEEQIEEVESGASSQFSSLDSSLRSLIAQEVAKCLKTSGGAMEGPLHFGGVGAIGYSDNSDYRALWIDRNTGNAIGVFASDSPMYAGKILLRASDENKSADLWVHPDGAVEIKGNKVLTSAGGTMNASLLVTNILSSVNDGFGLYGGNNWRTGGYIELGGPNHTYPNHIQIKGGSRQLLEDIGTGWHIAGSPIITRTSSWRSGNDWYRKYSDGWIEQGGEMWVSGTGTHSIPLNTPFSITVYTVVASQAALGTGGGEWVNGQSITGRSTTSFDVYDVRSGGHTILWYACGY